jgi:hypothetical protein
MLRVRSRREDLPAILVVAVVLELSVYNNKYSRLERLGQGMRLSKDSGVGIYEMFQAFMLSFGGTSLVGLRHAVAKIPTRAKKNTPPTD